MLLDEVRDGEAFDFVAGIAAELPMQMICILLGVPESDRHWVFEAVEPGFDFPIATGALRPDRAARSPAACSP